jgi:SAM-dependent methyltransferase
VRSKTAPIAAEGFDIAISRFGTMFFADPASAFARIAQSLRPHGRLVMMVWQAGERNEWFVSIQRALGADASAAFPARSDPFSLADPSTAKQILETAGFAETTFQDVRKPVYYGADTVAALEWIRAFSCVAETMRRLPPAAREDALQRLRTELAAHETFEGVWLDSRAWIVDARRH